MGTIRAGLSTRTTWRLFLWHLIALTTVVFLVPRNGEALLIPSSVPTAALTESAARTEDLATIRRFLERRLIHQRLQDLGLTGEEIEGRLAHLTDTQLHQLSGQLEALAPGGNGAAVAIIILLLAAVGVLIYLYTAGKKVVVTK